MDENVKPDSSDQSAPPPVSYSRDQKPTWNVFGKFFALFSNRTTAILAVLVLIVGLGAATIAVQRSTETRQHAAGEQAAFFFSTGNGCSTPTTSATFSPNTTTTLLLCLNTNYTGVSVVNGFDVTIAKGSGITFSGITDGVDGTKLKTLVNSVNSDGTIRFSKVGLNNTISGTALYLGKITLTTASTGTGSINITKAQVVSPTSSAALSAAKPTLSYTISTSATLISSQGPCYPLGDVNLDRSVDSVDSQLILSYVARLPIAGTFNQKNADVDGDGQITSVDALMIQRYVARLPLPDGRISFTVCPKITPTPALIPPWSATPKPTNYYYPTPTPVKYYPTPTKYPYPTPTPIQR